MASRIKHLRQEHADLKREGQSLFDAAAKRDDKTLTEAEGARIDAINARLEAIGIDIAREEKLLNAERLAENVDRAAEERAQRRGRRASAYAAEGGFETHAPFGEFLQAVARAGGWGGASTVDQRLLSAASGGAAGVPGEGGFLIRPTWSDVLLQQAREESKLYGRCFEIPIGPGSDSFEAPYLQATDRSQASTRHAGVQVYRRAEADTVTATKIDQFKKFELRLEDLMGIGYVTDRLLQDAVALQTWIEAAFSSAAGFKIDDEIFRGTGAAQCLGAFHASNPCLISQAKETGQAADTVVAENVIKMFSRMKPGSMGNASWAINAELLPQLMQMYIATGTGGQLVYTPPGGLSGAPYGALLGRPVEALEHCSAKGDVGDIVFADWSQYIVIAKGGMEMADSIHVRFLYGERTFRFMWRMNGQPKDPAVTTPYKGNNTVSPFVALAAR